MHAGVACSCGTDPPACGTPPQGGTGMSFHSLRCLICLADISIIPSEERCDLPLQGGFRGDRRLIPLATARLGGFLLALPHPLVEPPAAAEMLVAASLSDPAVVELHDLADLVGPTRWWVMSRTDRPSVACGRSAVTASGQQLMVRPCRRCAGSSA